MRILFDSNVLISAFITRGVSSEVLDHCLVSHHIVISDYILDEFSEKLRTKFGYSLRESYMARNALKEQCIIIEPQPLGSRVSRDVEDDPILAAASDGHCDCLITGDKDLLVLRTYNGIPIFKPSDFFAWERRRGE